MQFNREREKTIFMKRYIYQQQTMEGKYKRCLHRATRRLDVRFETTRLH